MPSNMMYPHLQRSSPTTATAIASATVTIQNVPNSIPPFASRGTTPHFTNQYHINSQIDYRTDNRSKQHYPQMAQMYSSDMYNPEHPTVNEGQTYLRAPNHTANPNLTQTNRVSGRTRQNYHTNYQNQHQYYYNKSHGTADGYNMANQNNYTQGYHSEHPNYNHYGYTGNNMYPHDGTDAGMGAHNMANSVGHDPANYYGNETMHHSLKVQNQTEYQQKNYYENSTYNSNQMAPNSTETGAATYMGTELFPNTSSTNAAIMTPPTSVPTENSDNYNSFHQFYGGETATAQTQVPQPPPAAGESSNSSSDFNFLSNLANDYTPEYYQI